LIKQLSKKYKITLVCEKRGFQTEQDIAEVKKFCEEVITINRKKQWTWQNIAKAGFSTYPFLLTGHSLPEMKEKIVEVMMQKTFDIIHVETFYVFQNVPKTYVPIVLVEHNIEYLVYKRYAATAKLYLRPLLSLDVFKIKYWEEKYWKKAQALVAVSKEEAQKMKRADVAVIPNGVDLTKFKIQNTKLKMNKKEKKILFIGDFKWIQNRQSVEWILKEIWPKICADLTNEDSQLKLWIVGKNIPESLKLLGNETVIFDEEAPKETEKIFQQAILLLAPIKVGGGTQYKILEAMASGVPVITTTLGAEGIACNPKKDLLVADDTESIVKKTVMILQDQQQYETIAASARTCIEKQYNWELIAERLDKVYQTIASV
jgi:glycosyltransferase involved in cell wall biosynthesis